LFPYPQAGGFGLTQAEIANQLKISEPTLRKHFQDELSSGKFKVDMTADVKKVLGSLASTAEKRTAPLSE
jgi:DNA-binding transcriptional regulator LsrR (DeoR family)